MAEIKDEVKTYLASTQLMQISTSSNDQPWTATVYFAFDSNLNIYWLSRSDRRHSLDIEKNPKVSGAIAKLHTYGEKVRGVQFEGVAEKLKGNDATQSLEIYYSRYNKARDRVKNILVGAVGETVVIYKVKPTKFVLFDEVNFPENPRQEIVV